MRTSERWTPRGLNVETCSISYPPTAIKLGAERNYRAFSLTWSASMLIYWNKRTVLHKKRVHLPQDWLWKPTWPPFHCFGTAIWPPWRHVKTVCKLSAHLFWEIIFHYVLLKHQFTLNNLLGHHFLPLNISTPTKYVKHCCWIRLFVNLNFLFQSAHK